MSRLLVLVGVLATITLLALSVVYFRSSNGLLPAQVIMMTAVVPGCGNGLIEDGEECDGAELVGATCQTKGFVSGTLSCTSSCLYNVTTCEAAPTSSGGGGSSSSGGGGGSSRSQSSASINNTAQVVFTGRAYPSSVVTVLVGAKTAATAVADGDGNFQVSVTGLAAGIHNFSLYSVDAKQIRSTLTRFPIELTRGVAGRIELIFIAPTIVADKSQVKRSESITFTGQTVPGARVELTIGSAKVVVTADARGAYAVTFDTSTLTERKYTATVRATVNKVSSTLSDPYTFTVGKSTVLNVLPTNCKKVGDLNDDCRVNLVDFSILVFWFERPLSPEFTIREQDRLSGDGKVNLVDFSIMAFNWTG